MMAALTRMQRLLEALAIAERHGNSFMAANIKAAIREEQRTSGAAAPKAAA